MSQLRASPDAYSPYVPGSYAAYVDAQSRAGTWGDAITLQAVADRYGVRVCILSSYPTRCFLEVVPRGGRHASRRVLWLSFLAEQHYNSLYPSHAPPPPLPHDKLLGSRRLYALVRGGAPEDAAATALRAAG